jgi:hypothetical protein
MCWLCHLLVPSIRDQLSTRLSVSGVRDVLRTLFVCGVQVQDSKYVVVSEAQLL